MVNKPNSFELLKQLLNHQRKTPQTSDADTRVSFVEVTVAEAKFYLAAKHILEVVSNPTILPVGHTQPWLKGITKVQGNVYSVIDTAMFLSLDTALGKDKMLIALSTSMGNHALLVSAVGGISLVSRPKPLGDSGFIVNYETLDKQRLPVLSISTLLASPTLANMANF